MEQSLTQRALETHRLAGQEKQKPAIRKVTNFEELNERLAAYEVRLSDLETRMYQNGWGITRLEADHDALLRRHNGFLKTSEENLRDIERELDALAAKDKELRAYINERHEDVRKGGHVIFDEIVVLQEYVDFLLSKAAPEQLEFRRRVREILRKKDAPKG